MSKRRFIQLAIVLAVVALAWVYFPRDNAGKSGQAGNGGAPIVSVKIPSLNAAAQQGEKLFNDTCATCHGTNAVGQNGVAPPLVHKIYEPSHHGDASFYSAAKNGVRSHHWPFGNMPPVTGVSNSDLDKIIGYVRVLQRANGIH